MEQTTLTTKKKDKHVIDSVFVICLMLLFVLCALSVIAIGASIYQKNVSAMASNNSHRIASAYITEKVRQADIDGTVRIKERNPGFAPGFRFLCACLRKNNA